MACYENVIFRCSFHQLRVQVNPEWSADAFYMPQFLPINCLRASKFSSSCFGMCLG